MLRELSISQFALIDQVHLEFDPGLNIITGETGAGKSILLGALTLVLGGRAQSDLIRSGAESARVEARFQLPDPKKQPEHSVYARLRDLGLEPDEEGDLIITRSITSDSKSGKNRITVNGQMITRQNLLGLAQGLVDLSGQREHQILLDPKNHLLILDRFANHFSLIQTYQNMRRAYLEVFKRYTQLTSNESERLKRLDYLTYQIAELTAAQPQAGEEAQLQEEISRLAHVDEILELGGQAAALLDEPETGILENLTRLEGLIRKIERQDGRFGNARKGVEEAQIATREISVELTQRLQGMEANPKRLKHLEDRLATLHHLSRKHGVSIDHLPETLAAMQQEWDQLQVGEDTLQDLKAQCETTLQEALKQGKILSDKRREAAQKLADWIQKELGSLGMKGTRFTCEFSTPASPTTQLKESGLDDLQFLIAPNVGEGLKPLHEIASGGELSRILLSLKCILAPAAGISTYLFDEIDSGIGGETGNIVGKKLKNLSQNRQVIAITHLPQIACFATRHFQIEKLTQKGRTVTRLEILNRESRIEELARMLSGQSPSETSRKHARELLENGFI